MVISKDQSAVSITNSHSSDIVAAITTHIRELPTLTQITYCRVGSLVVVNFPSQLESLIIAALNDAKLSYQEVLVRNLGQQALENPELNHHICKATTASDSLARIMVPLQGRHYPSLDHLHRQVYRSTTPSMRAEWGQRAIWQILRDIHQRGWVKSVLSSSINLNPDIACEISNQAGVLDSFRSPAAKQSKLIVAMLDQIIAGTASPSYERETFLP